MERVSMAYDEDTLNDLHDRPMTGRRQRMSSDGTIYAFDAIRGLREIVAQYGPDTTRQCQYVEYAGGTDYDEQDETPVAPHCIVGHFLHRNGVSLEVLQSVEGESIRGAAVEIADLLKIDAQAAEVLWEAQTTQDSGYTWGKALEAAEATFAAQKGVK